MALRFVLLACIFPAFCAQALAAEAPDAPAERAPDGTPTALPAPAAKTFSTGVAKGRDLLDSAISATSLDETDLPRLGVSNLAGIIGNMPGIRVESTGSDGFSSMTVRGLPLSGDGSKYLLIQEDGLPVLEFGDIHFGAMDTFVRADLSLSQVQAIRGGSASTFASNSPGGVINLISKTGEEAGGAVRYSGGLDYDLNRADFSYGAPIGHGWRFHIGGFYRIGEGPRHLGYNGFSGGQVKFNVTHDFAGGGYVRFYGKYLDDRQPPNAEYPVLLSGSNDKPTIASLPGTDVRRDTLNSKYTSTNLTMDENNNPMAIDQRRGIHGVSRAFGVETQFDIGGWTVSDRFRYASNSGSFNQELPFVFGPAAAMGTIVGGPGATFSYATGPNAGQSISSPATLSGGSGLLFLQLELYGKINKLDHVANDLRATRVWNLGSGKLTTTAGLYASQQSVQVLTNLNNSVVSVEGKAGSSYIDVTAANGTRMTDGGIMGYSFVMLPNPAAYHRYYDMQYRVLAPYGSANYQFGRFALGGSLRLDTGKVKGNTYGAELGNGRSGLVAYDMNRDGTISVAESKVAVLPLGQPGIVDYTYRYLSYSVGVNYRLAPDASLFARYSRGGRAAGERVLFTPGMDVAAGRPIDSSAAKTPVKQAEGGFKLRKPGLEVYVTGFWAATTERDFQIGADGAGRPIMISVVRDYSAKGVELEATAHRGPFNLALGATYVKARIDGDLTDPTLVGNTPRHQPSLLFQARPEYATALFNVGAQFNGLTSSYAQDSNILKQPGYVIVSPYLFVRPLKRVELGLSAYNVFDKLGIVSLAAASIPASGVANAQVLNGRTVTGSLRLEF